MATVCQTENFDPGIDGGKPSQASSDTGLVLQTVATGEILFQPGNTRTLYRIERGTVCHYMLWADGRHDVIEFAFPGDIVGLGEQKYVVITPMSVKVSREKIGGGL